MIKVFESAGKKIILTHKHVGAKTFNMPPLCLQAKMFNVVVGILPFDIN
jgi:hypothetical protein